MKSRITQIYTDSFLTNRLFYDKLFIIIDVNVWFAIVNIVFYDRLSVFIRDIRVSKINREWLLSFYVFSILDCRFYLEASGSISSILSI